MRAPAGDDVATSEHADTASVVSMNACPSNGSDPSCPVGSFRVACKDGHEEVDTIAQVQSGDLCAMAGAPIRSGVYQSLDIYGNPDSFGDYMIDVTSLGTSARK